MRSLDNIPVPMTDLDKLLIDMKFRRILPFIKGKVLDVGCGVGYMTAKIFDKGFDVEGVDGSQERIDEALKYVPEVTFNTSYFKDFKPGVIYDTLVVSSVLEHIKKNPEISLKWFATWLKPGGTLIALVPNRRALHKLVGREMGYRDELTKEDKLVGHHQLYDLSKLCGQLTRTGFYVRSCGGVLMKPVHNRALQYWNREHVEAYFAVSGLPNLAQFCSVVYAVGIKND